MLASGLAFQHAIQGLRPPVPVLRRLGLRSARETEQEGCAPKMRCAASSTRSSRQPAG
jgi:hypothetical protein